MTNSINELIYQFERIKSKDWILNSANGTGGVGVTFEKELGNNENNSTLPDFGDIEIKCTGVDTIYPITLFSTILDGPSNYEVQRLVAKYGYYDTKFLNRKILYAPLSCKKAYLVNKKYYFKLEVNQIDERVYIVIYDINNVLIEKISYISFQTIKNHLTKKLSKLAIVYALKKYENGLYYYKYFDMSIYTLKSFDAFVTLLENGNIYTSLSCRIMKSARHFGKTSSKNIVFSLYRVNIPKLFDRVF